MGNVVLDVYVSDTKIYTGENNLTAEERELLDPEAAAQEITDIEGWTGTGKYYLTSDSHSELKTAYTWDMQGRLLTSVTTGKAEDYISETISDIRESHAYTYDGMGNVISDVYENDTRTWTNIDNLTAEQKKELGARFVTNRYLRDPI